MKIKNILFMAALLAASLSVARAQTTIAAWNFENLAITNYSPNPAPSLNNSVGVVSIFAFGMNLYPTPALGTNDPDITQGAASDTGVDLITNLTQIWRVRAQLAGNGWSTNAPVGTQGIQINADTTGFTNISVAFDWYLTKRGEANMQLEYTTNGSTWINIPITIPAAQSGSSLQFVDNTADTDPNSVQGYYVNSIANSGGQEWFTNLTAIITDPNAGNNPNFGIQIVNASTGASCVDGTGGILNNSSGNWRFDNISISGTTSGTVLTPPTITNSTVATVDGPFTNTFLNNNNWINHITSIKVNGTVLTAGYVVSAGKIIFTPSASVPANLLQTSGLLNITIDSTGYSLDSVSQYLAPGAAKQLTITTQPAGPTGNGGTLVTQPVLTVLDQYGNVATNCTATYTATSSSGWSFGTGSGIAQVLTGGMVTFTNLSATSAAAVPGATMTFTASGTTGLSGLPYTTTNSSTFNIPAPRTTGFTPGNLAVFQVDQSANNSTFSILELNSGIPNQSSPVNTFPITATGPNAMRMSSSSSTGRLSDSADGTLVCFNGFLDGSSATSDETSITNRGAGTLDPSGNYVLQASYQGNNSDPNFGTTQARSATSLDNITFYMGDKYGVYTNDNYVVVSGSGGNVRPLKCFGGKIYALTQSGGTQPTVLLMNYINGNSLYPLNGFPVEPLASDFYMVASGQHGNTNDILYYIDPTNTTSGAIFKFCLSYDPANNDVNGQQGWVPAGQSTLLANGATLNSAPTPDGGDGLCAATNASGGVDLYFTTGTGSTVSNSLVKVTDSAGYNQAINLGSFQTLYTTGPNAILKGVAFAPAAHTLAASLSGGKFMFTFSAATGMSFSVLATNNIAAPRTTWPVIGTATEILGNPGHYEFTDPNPSTNSTRFYILRQP
jgi:hypothetical protein